MQKRVLKKISIVGLVLICASAAATIPSKRKATSQAKQMQGNLTLSSFFGGNDTLTCSLGEEDDSHIICDHTETHAVSDSLTSSLVFGPSHESALDSFSITTIVGMPVLNQTKDNTTFVRL